jgi:hypothetical protein
VTAQGKDGYVQAKERNPEEAQKKPMLTHLDF